MLLVCYNLQNSQNIPSYQLSISQVTVKMVGYKDTPDIVKKVAEVAQKKEQ